MSEIEKMYRNAHVYPKVYGDITKETFENRVFKRVDMCNEAFTAEKQLELIKSILASSTDRNIDLYKQDKFYRLTVIHIGTDKVFEGIDKDFSVALAGLINQLWQDLTEQERTEIRSILNG